MEAEKEANNASLSFVLRVGKLHERLQTVFSIDCCSSALAQCEG